MHYFLGRVDMINAGIFSDEARWKVVIAQVLHKLAEKLPLDCVAVVRR